jgi:hypothetical protein
MAVTGMLRNGEFRELNRFHCTAIPGARQFESRNAKGAEHTMFRSFPHIFHSRRRVLDVGLATGY